LKAVFQSKKWRDEYPRELMAVIDPEKYEDLYYTNYTIYQRQVPMQKWESDILELLFIEDDEELHKALIRHRLIGDIESYRGLVALAQKAGKEWLPFLLMLPKTIHCLLGVHGCRFANRPEFGRTYTRKDGAYDLAIDGNQYLHLRVSKAGFIPVDRSIHSKIFLAGGVQDIILLPMQESANKVEFGRPILVSGDLVSDDSGARRTSVFFPENTQAKLEFSNGASEEIKTISLRIDEVTRGQEGRASMMADLPARTLYTYAAEFSVDEAIAKNAEKIVFVDPVFVYIDNFLGFEPGSIVPSGFYDRGRLAWEPMPNGIVLKVENISEGLAQLRAGNSPLPDISNDEKKAIATRFAKGDTFWRIPTKHFSPYDMNWGSIFPPGTNPPPLGGEGHAPNCQMGQEAGSIIGCPTQTLAEGVPLNGTPFVLSYRTSRSEGYKAILDIPVKPVDPSQGVVLAAKIRATISGKKYEKIFEESTTIPYATSFIWDGKDQFGRKVQGAVNAEIEVSLAYNAPYLVGSSGGGGLNEDEDPFPPSFDTLLSPEEGVQVELSRGRVIVRRRYTKRITAGTLDVGSEGLGGWTLNVHHRYDPIGRAVYYGHGADQFARSDRKIEIVAGASTDNLDLAFESPPDGALARELNYWGGLNPFAVDRDGTLLVIDQQTIRSIDPFTNMISTRVGKNFDYTSSDCLAGIKCDTWEKDEGDGKAIEEVRFLNIENLKIGRDGRLYVLSSSHLWRMENDGTASIILNAAENGLSDFGDGAFAKTISTDVKYFDIADQGTAFFVDGKNQIFKIATDGRLRFVAGTSRDKCDATPCQGAAKNAFFNNIRDIAVSDIGDLYIVEDVYSDDTTYIRKIGNDGMLSTYAGPLPADKIDVGPAGEVYISMQNTPKTSGAGIVQVLPNGELKARVGLLGESDQGNMLGGFLGKPAIDHESSIRAVAPGMSFDIAPDGTPFYGLPAQIFKAVELLPGYTGTEIEIPSTDGNQIYVFSKNGQHLNTHDANTGSIVWTFEYDQENRLESVIDRDGDRTRIVHDQDGNPLSIIGPNNITWTFQSVDRNLTRITSPENESSLFEYDAQGLMTRMESPRGEVSTFDYDRAGRLLKDHQPNGGTSSLNRDISRGRVRFTSAAGRKTDYLFTPPGVLKRKEGEKTGDLMRITQDENDGWTLTTSQDGSVLRTLIKSHPLYGPIAAYPETQEAIMPSGLKQTTHTEIGATLYADDLRSGLLNWSIENTMGTRVSKADWDHETLTLSQDTGEGRRSKVVLNADARPQLLSSPGLEDTKLEYDNEGRLSKIIRGSRELLFQYSGFGYPQSITSSDGTVKYTRDKMGRVLTLERKDASLAQFTYDPWGYLNSITPPGAATYTMHYDERANLTFMDTPNSTRSEYEYDLDHRPTKMTLADGRVVTFSYDESNRIKKVVSDGTNYDYTYLMTGQIEKIEGADANLAFTWDGPLLKTQSYSGSVSGNLAVDYNDKTLDVKSMNINGETINMGYDGDGIVTTIGALDIAYINNTVRIKERALEGLRTSYSYNMFGEPERIQTNEGLLDEQFEYDALGRIIKLSREDLNSKRVYEYTYDLLGQIIEVKIDGSVSESYTYDEKGNRTSATGIAASRIRYDGDERMERYGSFLFTYDGAGKLKTRRKSGKTTTYNYSVTGRLKSVKLGNGKTISYQHDALDRRITRKSGNTITQRFLYGSGLGPIAEVDANGDTISTFVYGTRINVPDYMIRNGKTYYFVLNYLGSVRAVVDVVSGNVEQEIDYDTFGRVLSDSNPGYQPFGFAGGLYDHETGLVRFGARDYDALTGRWTAPDPIGFNGGQFNLYVYVNGDPVNFVDLSGANAFLTRLTPILFTVLRGMLKFGTVAGSVSGMSNLMRERTRAEKQGRQPNYRGSFSIGFGAGFVGGAAVFAIGRFSPKGGVVAGTSISGGLTAQWNLKYGLVSCENEEVYVAEQTAQSALIGMAIVKVAGGFYLVGDSVPIAFEASTEVALNVANFIGENVADFDKILGY